MSLEHLFTDKIVNFEEKYPTIGVYINVIIQIPRYSNHQIIAFFEEKNRESTVFVGFKKSYRMIRILMIY